MDLYFARELYEMAVSASQMELDQLEYISVEGWVRTNRDNGQVGFIEMNDGTYFKNIQIVYNPDLENHDQVSHLLTGSAIYVIGKFVSTPQNKQPFEILATSIEIEGDSDETYPLQKKRHTFEFLREIPHLRPRTNTFMAVFRVRSALAMAIHE
ncbi:MAG: asparagine--tRNA ligase, partial [Erysipelotrichaceae bacterium]|nr:asparagine--tRNA ligase [Erysipelotrichaceae bacterium]